MLPSTLLQEVRASPLRAGFRPPAGRRLSVLRTITNFHLPDIPTHAYNHVTVHGMPDKARVLAKYEVLQLVRKTVQMYSFLYSGSLGTVVKPLQPETYIF